MLLSLFTYKILVLFSVFSGILYIFSSFSSHTRSWSPTGKGVQNRTLGFEKIIAITPRDADPRFNWRKDGLKAAGDRTGVTVQFPQQPLHSKFDVKALSEGNNAEHAEGHSKCWLGHLSALKLAAGYSTTLIMEDDADWDVHIKRQLPPVAAAIRQITAQEKFGNIMAKLDSDPALEPYGKEWDVLFLGHCGDAIDFSKPFRAFPDPTVPPYVNSYYVHDDKISPDPHGMRWVHSYSAAPCLYAYAVTNVGANKILAREDMGGYPVDLWVRTRCNEGYLKCITINPELFHHHRKEGKKDSVVDGSFTDVIESNRTENILHSARCNWDKKDNELVSCMGKDERKKPEEKE